MRKTDIELVIVRRWEIRKYEHRSGEGLRIIEREGQERIIGRVKSQTNCRQRMIVSKEIVGREEFTVRRGEELSENESERGENLTGEGGGTARCHFFSEVLLFDSWSLDLPILIVESTIRMPYFSNFIHI